MVSTDRILGDLTVLDVTQGIPGPHCTKLLAALGARVIKIEPSRGDIARRFGPFFHDEADPEKSGTFLYLNTGKESVTINLDTAAGAALLKRLIGQADVFVESYPPGTLAGWGLGYDDLAAERPGLIYTSITDFGQTGPYRDLLGGEIVIEALGGLLYTMGLPEREPLKIGGNAALMTGGIAGFSAILVAVHQRDESGLGQHLDISLQETVALTQIHASLSAQFDEDEPGRQPSTMSRAADGWVTVGIQQAIWPRFCEMIGRPDLVDDPRLANWRARQDNPDVLDAALADWLSGQSKEDVYHLLQAMRSVAGYVADVSDLFKSKQYQSREYFRQVDHPATGPVDYPGPLFRLDDLPWRLDRAPLLGEHSEAVLHGDLALPKEEIVRLRAQGAI